VVISAPSGCGKTTVIQEILARRPDFAYSVSTTTRPPRDNETEGVDYYFVTKDEFKRRIENGLFVEWELVHGHYYGTERTAVRDRLERGVNVLLDIDVNGGAHIKRLFPDSLLIFLEPPSIEELQRRLRNRQADDETAIARRLERFPLEMKKGAAYQFHIVNDDLERTVKEILRIIDSQTATEKPSNDQAQYIGK